MTVAVAERVATIGTSSRFSVANRRKVRPVGEAQRRLKERTETCQTYAVAERPGNGRGQVCHVKVKDIGPNGLTLLAPRPMEVGETLSLSIHTPVKTGIAAEAEIKEVVNAGGDYRVDASFTKLEEAHRALLRPVSFLTLHKKMGDNRRP